MNDFFKRFEAKYGKKADVSYGLRGYSAVQAWAEAANKAGSLDGAKVAAVLDTFDKEPLVIGPTTYTQQAPHPDDAADGDHRTRTNGKFAASAASPWRRSRRCNRTAPRPDVSAMQLRAQGVTVRFGGLVAIDDVSISLARGEMLGLIGPNGAGKTTLVNVLSGFQRPLAGAIAVGERDCTRPAAPRLSPRRRRAHLSGGARCSAA